MWKWINDNQLLRPFANVAKTCHFKHHAPLLRMSNKAQGLQTQPHNSWQFSEAWLHQSRQPAQGRYSPLRFCSWEPDMAHPSWASQTGRSREFKERKGETYQKKKKVRKVFQEVERRTSLNKQLTWMKTKCRPLSGQLTGWGKTQRLRQAQATLGEDHLSKENSLDRQPVLWVVEYRA